MKKQDKTQGIVFVLPKSREFFGRISQDFQKTGLVTQSQSLAPLAPQPVSEYDEKELESLQELKENLQKLTKLHARLKTLLNELDDLVEEEA